MLALLLVQEGEFTPFSINTGLIFWTIVVFGILLALLWRFGWPALLKAVEDRERRIQQQLEEAERARTEAARLLEEHKRTIATAKAEAQRVLAKAKALADKERETLLAKARQEYEQLLERARHEIDAEKEKAIVELRREAVDLSIAAASKLLQAQLDSETNRKLVIEYLAQLEAGGGGGKRPTPPPPTPPRRRPPPAGGGKRGGRGEGAPRGARGGGGPGGRPGVRRVAQTQAGGATEEDAHGGVSAPARSTARPPRLQNQDAPVLPGRGACRVRRHRLMMHHSARNDVRIGAAVAVAVEDSIVDHRRVLDARHHVGSRRVVERQAEAAGVTAQIVVGEPVGAGTVGEHAGAPGPRHLIAAEQGLAHLTGCPRGGVGRLNTVHHGAGDLITQDLAVAQPEGTEAVSPGTADLVVRDADVVGVENTYRAEARSEGRRRRDQGVPFDSSAVDPNREGHARIGTVRLQVHAR